MSTISGLELKRNRGMNHWESLVEEWVLAHERFARFCPDDAAYWYTERANVGILAGAAWRCGLVALEEFQATKNNQLTARRKDRREWQGRCDLWLVRDKANEVVEAKYRVLSIRSRSAASIASTALVKALKDAKNSRWEDDSVATGLVFMPVTVPVRRPLEPDAFIEAIDHLIADLRTTKPALLAWCFPDATRTLIGSHEKNFWPGVVMLGVSHK